MKKKIVSCFIVFLVTAALTGCIVSASAAESNPVSDEKGTDAGERISPAESFEDVLVMRDKAFSEHDFDYIRAAYIEPFGQEYLDFLLYGITEDEYWDQYDESQGRYYDIGVFECYSSEITKEVQVTDLEAIEENLQTKYDYSCTVQDAREITYDQTAKGTEGSAVNEDYKMLLIQVDGFWYAVQEN